MHVISVSRINQHIKIDTVWQCCAFCLWDCGDMAAAVQHPRQTPSAAHLIHMPSKEGFLGCIVCIHTHCRRQESADTDHDSCIDASSTCCANTRTVKQTCTQEAPALIWKIQSCTAECHTINVVLAVVHRQGTMSGMQGTWQLKATQLTLLWWP